MAQDLQHFIPFTRHDLLAMCLQSSGVSKYQKNDIVRIAGLLQKLFHSEFYQTQNELTLAYEPFDPDLDTRQPFLDVSVRETSGEFKQKLERVLEQGNFIRLTKVDLEAALSESSLFKIRLHIDFDEFEEVLVYCRGISIKTEVIPELLGLRKREIEFTNYDRVVLYLRFKDTASLGKNVELLGRSRKTLLKLFRNVPKADLEMLFPNTRIGMRLLDKLLIGIPALVSGGVVLTTKLGATLVLLSGVLGFWLGLHNTPVALDSAALLALAAGVGAVAGYLWKQFNSFKNRKLRFSQALTQNLYFKSLDNNAGVFYRLIADAEDEEFKETFLAWFFLSICRNGLTQDNLDRDIEQWFQDKWQTEIDFEVEDGLKKLERLGLARCENGVWKALSIGEALLTVESEIVRGIKG
ncbi:TMEM143 family protein [Teredinibacter haidensis]|uniref:TMEM143 family protein n=1 Tax=Teredinibacter haidensis TaxID=2731755 RepID=UPI000948F734|nr:TMEM143 family protein [Teredinibacter haidensis]